VAREVWGGEYDHPELPTDVKSVLDIGAGWGAFAAWGCKRWPSAIIHCFEPHAAACDLLRINTPEDRVKAWRLAVTTQKQHAWLSVGPYDTLENWGALTVHGTTDDMPGIQVDTIHPKDLPPVDLVKIDAEGVEPEFMEHYPHMAGVKAIMYEFHNATHRRWLRDFCTKSGFRCLREVQAGGHTEEVIWGPSVWLRDNRTPEQIIDA
jgi:FkbM family methyltransferase